MERDSSIDLIKFIAIIMVIILHVSSSGFSSTDSSIWNGANFFESITRTCVPLFFMITGTLLIDKPWALTSVAMRIKRLLIPFIFWSLAYLAFFKALNNQSINILSVFYQPAAGHLWYLYALAGVYITIPIIGVLYFHSSSYVKIYILMVWFFSCILMPTFKSYDLPTNESFDLSTIGLYQGYFFAGAVLSKLKKTITLRLISLSIFTASSLAILFTTRHLFIVEGLHDVRNYLNSSVFVCIASFSAFLTLHGIKIQSPTLKSIIAHQSKYTFGVYLTHLSIVYAMGSLGLSITRGNVYYFIPSAAVLIYITSLAICLLIHKARAGVIIS